MFHFFRKKKKHERMLYLVIAAIAFAEILFSLTCYEWIRPRVPDMNSFVQSMTTRYVSQLDGTRVTSAAQTVPQVFGVMIDNHPDARPQSGVGQARIVYEAPAEGGITRYFAIFNAADDIKKIGPVRSARPYFIDWMREYGTAPYVHSGGSPAALDILASDNNVWDANEFSRGDYFWRSYDRLAPHNLYTSSQLMNSLIEKYQSRYTPRDWIGWKFSPGIMLALATGTSTNIIIPYTPGYTVEWEYNRLDNTYVRFINNKLAKDDMAKPLTARNVIVQYVESKVLDEVGRKEIGTVGQGSGWVFSGGAKVPVTWTKADQNARTVFVDDSGHEVNLAPGITWVQVVPKEIKIED